MKFFASFMAILVLALSCMPCMDDALAMNKGKADIIAKSTDQQQNDHNDACSPFCQCACCAGFSINYSIVAISTVVIFCNSFLTSYLPGNIIEVSLPIWQPPQLV